MATFTNILEKHGTTILKTEVTFIKSFTSQIQAAVSSEIIVPCTKIYVTSKKNFNCSQYALEQNTKFCSVCEVINSFHRLRERENPETMLDPYINAKISLFLSETMFRQCHRQCHYITLLIIMYFTYMKARPTTRDMPLCQQLLFSIN